MRAFRLSALATIRLIAVAKPAGTNLEQAVLTARDLSEK
jgi:hypothetical protein